MKVRAEEKGYYGDTLRYPGDEFTLADPRDLGRWMVPVDGQPVDGQQATEKPAKKAR